MLPPYQPPPGCKMIHPPVPNEYRSAIGVIRDRYGIYHLLAGGPAPQHCASPMLTREQLVALRDSLNRELAS